MGMKQCLHDLEWIALCNYYDKATVKILIHKIAECTEPFESKSGAKQGGPLSPTAWNKHIDKMIREMSESGLL